MQYEWDPKKAEANVKKHGVSFVEASTVFGDALAATISDSKHSEFEVRFIPMGMPSGNLLVVSHTDEERASGSSARGWQPHRKKDAMSQEPEDDDLEPEYDFSGAVRGKYYQRYQQGTNVVLLDPDVAQAFKDSESVNRALRLLLDLAKQEVPQSR